MMLAVYIAIGICLAPLVLAAAIVAIPIAIIAGIAYLILGSQGAMAALAVIAAIVGAVWIGLKIRELWQRYPDAVLIGAGHAVWIGFIAADIAWVPDPIGRYVALALIGAIPVFWIGLAGWHISRAIGAYRRNEPIRW